MHGCNNFKKKIVLCHHKDFLEVVSKNVDEVKELGDIQDYFLDKEINLEMNYTSDKRAKCSIGGFGFYFDDEEGSEDETMTRYDDKENEKILEKNWEQGE